MSPANIKKFLDSPTAEWLLRLMVLGSLVLGVQVGLSQRALSTCIASWGDRYTSVAQARSSANQARLDAQNRLTLDFVEHVPDARFSQDAVTYIEADQKYQAAILAHPLPEPPRLAC